LVSVNLRAQASQALESFEREQVAQVELIGDSVRAVGDPERVRQIVRNLISNALRYGGDTIRVEVLSAGGNSRVLVCDNGPPIADEDRERIFQPYQRAHDAPGLPDSLGLGLSISRQLAQLMGGDLTYRHHNGESIFELALPPNA
jgi:two-component system sensor histidine kinase EvgS